MLAGAQSVLNAFCPFGPVMLSARLVSGRSGTSANVTVPLARPTSPVSVSPNGAGNETRIFGALIEPVSVTVPLASAASGTPGAVAFAVPIWHGVPVRHGPAAVTFGVRPFGSVNTIVLLDDSPTACVWVSVMAAPLSLLSLVIAAVSFGAYFRFAHPVGTNDPDGFVDAVPP